MSNFTLSIEGIPELRQALNSGELTRKVILGMGKAINSVHLTLQAAVFKRYSFKKQLTSVRVGAPRDLRYVPSAIQVIEGDLTYSGPDVPLFDFDHTSELSAGPSSYFIAPNIFTPNIEGRVSRETPEEVVKVSIVRGRKSLVKGGFTNYKRPFSFSGRTEILKKEEKNKTWEELPSRENLEGRRAKYNVLYGPSLPQAAAWVYENDPKVAAQIEKVSDYILEELTAP